MQFPELIQACLLFDRARPFELERWLKDFLSTEEGKGVSYKSFPDNKPGVFHRLYGSNDLMIAVEYIDAPAAAAIFERALRMPFNQTATPDARDRIARHRSHLLINVSHGVIPPSPQHDELLAKLNIPHPGASLAAFKLRLDACARLAALAHRTAAASLAHWVCTDTLLRGDVFSTLAEAGVPSPLHVQMYPYGPKRGPDGKTWVELTTIGVAHFLGREVHILPSPVPWTRMAPSVLAFLSLAIAEGGYVVPDGDTFGPEDGSVTCRVRHIGEGEDTRANETQRPVYELEILDFPGVGYRVAGYAPPTANALQQSDKPSALSRVFRFFKV